MRCFSVHPLAQAIRKRQKRHAETVWFRSTGRERRLWSKNSDGGRNVLRRASCESLPIKKNSVQVPKFRRPHTHSERLDSIDGTHSSLHGVGWVSLEVFGGIAIG